MRYGNTKAKVPVEHFEALKSQFLFEIKATVEMQKIPLELIIDLKQTGIKFMPVSSWTVSSWTVEQKGAKRVEILWVDDKRRITASCCWRVFAFSAHVQDTSLPKFKFPSDWNVTYTTN